MENNQAAVWDDQRLSAREQEVILLAATGATYKEIGVKLDISVTTVREYWVRARSKTGAASRAQAVALMLTRRHERSTQALERANSRMLKFMMLAIDAAILLLDENGIIQSWNLGLMDILGYTENDLIGQPFSVIFTQADRDSGLPEEEMRLAREEGPVRERGNHLCKDGSVIPATGTLLALWNEHELYGYGKILRPKDWAAPKSFLDG